MGTKKKSNFLVFDIETNALELEKVTKFHCLCYQYMEGNEWVSGTITDPKEIPKLFDQKFEYTHDCDISSLIL